MNGVLICKLVSAVQFPYCFHSFGNFTHFQFCVHCNQFGEFELLNFGRN